jgi:thioester reductase-like protein
LDSNIKNKLVVIDGDLTEPDLGISEKDRSLLIERIHIIFHSAATLKFDEPLK